MNINSVAPDITILKMVKTVLSCLQTLYYHLNGLILVILFITHNIPLLHVEQNIITIMLPDLAQTTPILNNFTCVTLVKVGLVVGSLCSSLHSFWGT